MSTATPPFPLDHEASIVWLEDPATLPYVRQFYDGFCHFRARRPRYTMAGRLVGYAVLGPEARSSCGHFSRRLFWLADHDRDSQPEGVYRTGCPSEGVDPLTVEPGKPGRMTERAWGTPEGAPR